MSIDEPADQNEKTPQDPDEVIDQPVDPLDQTLVSYLDGELSDVETEEVEIQLATDPELRSRLCGLQATFDMLDELPRSEPGDAFLKSTLEMVITSIRKKKTTWHRWPVRVVVLGVAFAMASLFAFQIVRSIQTEPYRRFVADLDFLENVHMYDQIQDTAFLEELNQRGIFSDSTETVDVGYLDQSNQTRLDSLDAFQVSGIKQSYEAFNLKPLQNQKLLRSIHGEIFAHPDRDKLLATLHLYIEWLSTVQPPEEKYKLSELPVADRVDRVIKIRRLQAEQYFGRQGETSLPPEDVTRFFKWCSEFCESKREVMIEKFKEFRSRTSPVPSSRQRSSQFETFPAELVFSVLWAYDEQSALDLIESTDVEKLKAALSTGSANTLAGQSLAGQKKLVGRWLTAAIEAKNRRHVSDAALWEFYETTLTEQEQAELEGLQPSDMKEAIRRRYAYYYPPKNDEIWRHFRLQPRRGRGKWKDRNRSPNEGTEEGSPRD